MSLKGQTIIFRTDSSRAIGTGHVMRCLTLADGLRGIGANCYFICREHSGNIISLIVRKGYEVRKLTCTPFAPQTDARLAHADWLGATQTIDAKQTQEILKDLHPDWVVVDHYGLDHEWQHQIRHACNRIMVLDDLTDRQHDCDLLLNQNLGFTNANYKNLVSENCVTLLGPSYALLRPEFEKLRSFSLRRRDYRHQPHHLLLTMGGVDQRNATRAVIEALHLCHLKPETSLTVILGASCPWITDIQTLLAAMPISTQLLVDAPNMAELMSEADLAIGAAGSTSWERCCLGLPTLTIAIANNQQRIATELERHGVTIKLGDPFTPEFASSLSETFHTLIANLISLKEMAYRAASIVDGRGVARVISQMQKVTDR